MVNGITGVTGLSVQLAAVTDVLRDLVHVITQNDNMEESLAKGLQKKLWSVMYTNAQVSSENCV